MEEQTNRIELVDNGDGTCTQNMTIAGESMSFVIPMSFNEYLGNALAALGIETVEDYDNVIERAAEEAPPFYKIPDNAEEV